ncbi:MAG TPA: PIN domain-containing protein [Terracidiphilus sp.]|jgi:predicted nucleic acid-binding protein
MASPVKPQAALPRAFFDSNVLIYAEDANDRRKQGLALDLVETHARRRAGVVSVPVLGEYFSVVVRKLGLDPALARKQIEFYSLFPLVEPSVADVLAAVDLHRLYGFSYHDSLHLRCAQRAGCATFFTEDLHHGQVIDGVRVVNPFL